MLKASKFLNSVSVLVDESVFIEYAFMSLYSIIMEMLFVKAYVTALNAVISVNRT